METAPPATEPAAPPAMEAMPVAVEPAAVAYLIAPVLQQLDAGAAGDAGQHGAV